LKFESEAQPIRASPRKPGTNLGITRIPSETDLAAKQQNFYHRQKPATGGKI